MVFSGSKGTCCLAGMRASGVVQGSHGLSSGRFLLGMYSFACRLASFLIGCKLNFSNFGVLIR